ncbi:hypothetical protein IQ238_09240 [Pleurocapsales cyanobacterium LEGE 06147]|nr:hypothetical protein [Pleurocapsales cyanobacterium LEGE 06147]
MRNAPGSGQPEPSSGFRPVYKPRGGVPSRGGVPWTWHWRMRQHRKGGMAHKHK